MRVGQSRRFSLVFIKFSLIFLIFVYFLFSFFLIFRINIFLDFASSVAKRKLLRKRFGERSY